MPEFTPDTYRILIVEDCPIWRRELKAMYSRKLFGDERASQNIVLAATAEEAVKTLEEWPQYFNLISLDMNLGSRESLGIANGNSKIAVTGLDVFDKMQMLQRGAAVVVITGASSDSELPRAFAEEDKEGVARARITLASELQDQFQGAHRFFPKVPLEQSDIRSQVTVIERQLPRATLFSISKQRESQLEKVDLPSLCLMIVLDDNYFEGHNEKGCLFANPKHRVVRFDFFEECLPYLERVKIWDRWPDPDEFVDKGSRMDAQRVFYFREAQNAFDRAIQIADGNIVLRSKPASMLRCAPPKNTTTIAFAGKPKLTDVHKEFLASVARSKIVNERGGPEVGDEHRKAASELRTRLRQAFSLRTDEQDPVSSKHPQTGATLANYDINMEVFVCSKDYIDPPPQPKRSRRKKTSGGSAD